jgi:RNA polymerase sigma-70 factor (ECF subfamily)
VTGLDDLPARAAGGDADAFGRLMQATKSDLYRFVRRYVGDAEETYDLMQETYAAAWLAIRRYDPERSFETWLRAIAINKCRDWSRRRRVRRWLFGALDLDTPQAMAAPDPAPDAFDDLAAAQTLSRLNRAIADLPPQLKEPLLLTAIEARSQAETAALLGVSVKTIETRVARARRRLAQALGPRDVRD